MSMAKGNYREYLQGDIVRIKKYFYVLRPLLACKWIREKNSLPPMEFRKLVTELLPEGSLLAEINKLLQRKNRGDELDYEPRIPVINDFLEEQMHHFERSAKNVSAENPADNTLFNRIFREALDEVWVKTGRNHSDWART
jgi:predicted nucleotidyltransferase